jgi:outer membrane receptor for ferrienterochelin and colicin
MRGDQLGQFLQQLPAGMVDRVEVVPNPFAKYDPEGMAGIVNIVMKQNVDLGLSAAPR